MTVVLKQMAQYLTVCETLQSQSPFSPFHPNNIPVRQVILILFTNDATSSG